MRRKMFMFFAVLLLIAAIVAAPLVATTSNGSPEFLVLGLVLGATAAITVARSRLTFALGVRRHHRLGARDHAPIYRALAVVSIFTVAVLTMIVVGFAMLPTSIVALSLLTIVVCAAAVLSRKFAFLRIGFFGRVRDHRPIQVRHFYDRATFRIAGFAVRDHAPMTDSFRISAIKTVPTDAALVRDKAGGQIRSHAPIVATGFSSA